MMAAGDINTTISQMAEEVKKLVAASSQRPTIVTEIEAVQHLQKLFQNRPPFGPTGPSTAHLAPVFELLVVECVQFIMSSMKDYTMEQCKAVLIGGDPSVQRVYQYPKEVSQVAILRTTCMKRIAMQNAANIPVAESPLAGKSVSPLNPFPVAAPAKLPFPTNTVLNSGDSAVTPVNSPFRVISAPPGSISPVNPNGMPFNPMISTTDNNNPISNNNNSSPPSSSNTITSTGGNPPPFTPFAAPLQYAPKAVAPAPSSNLNSSTSVPAPHPFQPFANQQFPAPGNMIQPFASASNQQFPVAGGGGNQPFTPNLSSTPLFPLNQSQNTPPPFAIGNIPSATTGVTSI